MRSICEVLTERNSNGGVTVTTVFEDDGKLNTIERPFDSALYGIADASAREINSVHKYFASLSTIIAGVAIPVFDLAINGVTDFSYVATGAVLAAWGYMAAKDQELYYEEAELTEQKLAKMINPDSLPADHVIFKTIGKPQPESA